VPEDETDAYPFTESDVKSLGANYVALGHFHGVYPAWAAGDECQRDCCYSGTHEPDQFVGDAGYALLAYVTAGQPTRLQRVRVGRREWRRVLLNRPPDLERVKQLLEEMRNDTPARYVIRLEVRSRTGWAAEDVHRLAGLESSLRALGAQVERRGEIQPWLDVQSLDLAELPSGAVKEALLSLRGDYDRCEASPQREVFAAALRLGWEKLAGYTQP
jgi:hypothetical protein